MLYSTTAGRVSQSAKTPIFHNQKIYFAFNGIMSTFEKQLISDMPITTLYTPLRRVFLLLITCLFVAVGTSGCISDKSHSHEETTLVNVGDMAPDFTVDLLSGESVRLSSLHGQVVMLIFFSTECPDCQNQFAEIQQLVAEKAPSFKVLAISRGESIDATEKFSQKYGITFDVGTDPNLAIYNQYASRYVPRNFLIGADGRIEALTVEYRRNELHAIWELAEELCE